MTDFSQNDHFMDKYYNNIPLDLSKALFIFSLNDMEKMVKEKKILYDHFADQRKVDKWDSPVVLQPIDISFLPQYIIDNKNKFKDWLE